MLKFKVAGLKRECVEIEDETHRITVAIRKATSLR